MKSLCQLIIAVLISSLLLPQHLQAQVFGGHPPRQQWRSIRAGNYQLLFNPPMQTWAERLKLQLPLLERTAYALGGKTRPITMLLQSHTTVSNGYVGLGPWRSELYTTPLQNSLELGSLPWQEQLLLHEGRHIHQYANFNQGATKLFRLLAGDYGQDFFNNLIIPNWFWEGDAVWQETHLSEQGRGRLPHFFGITRALDAAGKQYSWQKLRNGSLRDQIPDHYQLGYQLTAYGYHQYGADFWKKVTTDALHLKGSFFPFQKAIQKHSGLPFAQFTRNALQYFQVDSAAANSASAQWAKSMKHFQADVHFPQWMNDSMVIYVKTSYDGPPSFVQKNIRSESETTIATRNISLDNYFSYRNGRIVYATLGFDKRWGWQDYGEITILDATSGQSQQITHKGKYFSPDINETSDQVVAVSIDSTGRSALKILNARTGALVNTLEADNDRVYTYPKFMNADHVVFAVREANAHMGLMQWEIATGKTNWLLAPGPAVIAFPNPHNNNLYFTATYKGKDEVLLLSIGSGAIYRAVKMNEGAAGHYAASGDLNKIAWVDQTAVGQRLRTISFTNTPWENITDSFRNGVLSDFGMHFSKRTNEFNREGAAVEPYATSKGLFRIHSWLPYAADPEYSLTMYSENLLNTMQGEFGILYNRNEGSTKLFGAATYAGWYPWVQVSAGKTLNRKGTTGYNTFSFHETETSIGWSIPLNLSGKNHYRSLQVGSRLTYAKSEYVNNFKDSFAAKGYAYSTAFLHFSNQVQRARKDIFPRYAQVLALTAHRSVATLKGFQWMVNGALYLPGLASHHNIVVQGALQQRDTLRQIFYSNTFPFTRGYLARNGRLMQKVGVNYHFPIAYPDRGIGNIVYLLRIRQNVFFDHTQWQERYEGLTYKRTYRSAGTEIYFDTKWWNQEPFTIGFRYSRLLDPYQTVRTRNQWEVVFTLLSK